jgi:hypothetical protein
VFGPFQGKLRQDSRSFYEILTTFWIFNPGINWPASRLNLMLTGIKQKKFPLSFRVMPERWLISLSFLYLPEPNPPVH